MWQLKKREWFSLRQFITQPISLFSKTTSALLKQIAFCVPSRHLWMPWKHGMLWSWSLVESQELPCSVKVSALPSLPETGYNFRVELSHRFIFDMIHFYFSDHHRHLFKKPSPLVLLLLGKWRQWEGKNRSSFFLFLSQFWAVNKMCFSYRCQ